MSELDEMRDLFAYHWWANDRLITAVANLSDSELDRDLGSSFPSVRATLGHMLGAERVWLSRWRGEVPREIPNRWGQVAISELRREWADVAAGQAAVLESLEDGGLHGVLEYRDLAGNPLHALMKDMLRHVVNHGTYHRGQVVTMLRQLGKTAPATDLIVYCREVRANPQSAGQEPDG